MSRLTALIISATKRWRASQRVGFAMLSLITAYCCAELSVATVLQAMGAVSPANIASSTFVIVGFAALSTSWVLWRLWQSRRTVIADQRFPDRPAWIAAILAVAALVVDLAR